MWEIVNESPTGYEPVYSVVEKETGREIAINLDLDEAIKIKYAIEVYQVLREFNDGVADKLYVLCRGDDDFMKEANESITKMEEMFHRMNRDYNRKTKIVESRK